MEYEYDRDQVQQLQGRLATDQVEEDVERLHVPKDQKDDELMQQQEEDVEKS